MKDIRIIAINLPQFHPFKENDEWWGKGFTEWTNVVKACPRFKGHYQPHIPSDTGFYDLRLPEARQMQADMAKEYGIYGFCYYHYWFNGKQLMDRPVNEILKSGKPDFPFMLCWANENWTRNWDGLNNEVLIEQKYSDEDDLMHIRWLCENVFSDKRYIRIDGKPVFAIYRIDLFPNIGKTISIWRKIAKVEYGMDLYIINAEFPGSPKGVAVLNQGLNASFDFKPLGWAKYIKPLPKNRFVRGFINHVPGLRLIKPIKNYVDRLPILYSYRDYIKKIADLPLPDYKCYPCVSPNWDNSPRRANKRFYAFVDSTPALFGEWLADILSRFTPYSKDENFVFINAWNEWAEGNYLEPDQRWGRGYLEEMKKAIMNKCKE